MDEGTDPNASQAPPLEELAPLFPQYEFVQFIAEGGMGAVYLARQISLDRPVAIKILAKELGSDPVFRASFEAEAKAMARLNHPNLIGVYDFGEAGGMLFIIMEMVNGKSLHQSAYGRTIDPVQAGTLVAAISRGLEHAHSAGILHRDIKPGNILLDSDANPKIGDFGLAQPMGQKTSEDELIYGTPGYTAPEVYHRQGDHRADIFSVGVLLHELLTGALPDGSGTPASRLCGCSIAFDKIIARSTNQDPAMRHQTAGELADELEKAILQSDAANASTNRLVLPSAAPTAKVAAAPVASGGVSRAKAQAQAQLQANAGGGKGPLIAILGVCTVLLIGLMAMLSGGGDDEAKTKNKKAQAEAREKQAAKERRQRENNRNQGDRPNKRDGLGKGERQNKERGNKPDQPVEPTVAKKPSPLDSLKALKGKLAGGARDEFPPGTEARGGSHFVLVDLDLTWPEAKRFAEEHGAHLAVLPDPGDRKWFDEKFPSENSFWLGGGMAANDGWQWLDGSKWNTTGGSVSAAGGAGSRALSLGKAGALLGNSKSDKRGFAIQWREDGSNPASVGAELKRTAESIKAKGVEFADYPVGTRTYTADGSQFYVVRKPIDWDAARKLAVAAGGYLAVPSSKEESDWLRETLNADLNGEEIQLWLGGYKLKATDPWRWLTNEAWNNNTGWAGGSAPVTSAPGRVLLGLSPEADGWVPAEGSAGEALGMLIEWSKPKQAAKIANFDLDAFLEKTDGVFTGRIEEHIEEYNKDYGLIIDRYIRNIKRLGRKHESILAGRDRKADDRIADAINEAVREVEKNDAILKEIPKAAPDDFHELQEKTEESIEEIVATFEKALTGEFNTYTQGLTKQATALAAEGFAEPSAALTERVTGFGGANAALLALLSLEDPTIGSIPSKVEEKKDEDDDKKD